MRSKPSRAASHKAALTEAIRRRGPELPFVIQAWVGPKILQQLRAKHLSPTDATHAVCLMLALLITAEAMTRD